MILAALGRRRNYNIFEESVLRFVVMPWDCVLKFVGNDRYHAFMDIGRIDLIIRIGWWKIIWRHQWEPFVRTADIRYRYPLRMFQRFTLRTRIIYWDEYHLWMEHSFERRGRTVAVAISKNLAKNKKGVVSIEEALRLLKRDIERPTCPLAVQIINDTEELLKTRQINNTLFG